MLKNKRLFDYLCKRGIPAKLTKLLADLTGKRVVFINMIASRYHNKEERDDDEFMEVIEKHLDGLSKGPMNRA